MGVIIAVLPSVDSVARYQVFHDASNIATYFENQLQAINDTSVAEMTPFEDFLGKYAVKKLKINSSSTMFALNSGRIKFIPFQFRPLARILNAERPRILIADEVGVGKTIETGIILKEFEKRDSVKSAIIICPKDLTSKWRREMKSRFDETFEVLTSERLSYCFDELEMEGIWPYECRKCIVGLEMLRREENIKRLDSIEDLASFDMLVVDEAHHVINRNSKSHQIVEYFCERLRIINNLIENSEDEISDSERRASGNRMPTILRHVEQIILTGSVDLTCGNKYIAAVNDGYSIYDMETDKEIRRITIDQNELGVDTEDRIEKMQKIYAGL